MADNVYDVLLERLARNKRHITDRVQPVSSDEWAASMDEIAALAGQPSNNDEELADSQQPDAAGFRSSNTIGKGIANLFVIATLLACVLVSILVMALADLFASVSWPTLPVRHRLIS